MVACFYLGKTIPPSPEAAFLRSVTDFVASQEMDPQYSQPVWPASTVAGGQLPTLRPPPEDAYRALERLSPRLPHREEAAAALGLPPLEPQQRLSPMAPARKVTFKFTFKKTRRKYFPNALQYASPGPVFCLGDALSGRFYFCIMLVNKFCEISYVSRYFAKLLRNFAKILYRELSNQP
jgi:hypothetical protein